MSSNLEARITTVEEAVQLLTQLALRADERMDAQDRRLDEFDRRMSALAEAQKQTEANLSALTSIAIDTEKRLNRLAETVERFISEGRNGNS